MTIVSKSKIIPTKPNLPFIVVTNYNCNDIITDTIYDEKFHCYRVNVKLKRRKK
jgi:hypothetical protein